MAGIKISSNIVKVPIEYENGTGDYIVLRKDIGFINKVVAFADGLSILQDEFNEKARLIADDDNESKLELIYQMHKEVHDALDDLFGVGTCKKVFGDGVVDTIPTIDKVVEFCEQITPFIIQVVQSLNNKPKTPTKTAIPQGYMGSAPLRELKPVAQSNAFAALRQQLGSEAVNDEV